MYLTSDDAWIVLTPLPSEESKYKDDLRDDLLAEGGNPHATRYQWLSPTSEHLIDPAAHGMYTSGEKKIWRADI